MADASPAKIVGGTPTSAHPAVAVTIADNGGNPTVQCSAALVAEEWVLTAASCAPSADYVGFGDDFVSAGATVTVYTVLERRLHPNWSGGAPDFDVALLRIAPSPPIVPLEVDLSPRSSADVGTVGTAVGFGVATSGGSDSGRKREAQLQISAIDARFLYAQQAAPNICSGDIGGPLLGGGRVVGLTLFGDAGCDEFSGFHRLDVVASFLLATAPICTAEAPCGERIFDDGFEGG